MWSQTRIPRTHDVILDIPSPNMADRIRRFARERHRTAAARAAATTVTEDVGESINRRELPQ